MKLSFLSSLRFRLALVGVLVLGLIVLAASRNKPVPTQPEPTPAPVSVRVQKKADSLVLHSRLELPATVGTEQEAKIIAKTSGTAKNLTFGVGKTVRLGDTLLQIDDVNSATASSGGLSAQQVKQARLAAEQAQTSYEMARTNYTNLLQSTDKDLHQIEITKLQAQTGQQNVQSTTAEALKSAELAYDAAKLATQQAKLTLDNRKTSANQTTGDTQTNSEITANSTVDSCNAVLVSLNNLAALDSDTGGSLPYSNMLGILNSQSMNTARSAYRNARAAVDAYRTKTFPDLNTRMTAALDIVSKTKAAADAMKTVADNTLASATLPQNSATGPSLSGIQTAVSGYQTQMNGLVAQLTGTQQGVTNVAINNTTSLDSIQKAYELAQQQERIAQQNLNNLKAGNKSQTDNAAYGVFSAENQYAGTKIKLNAQLSVSRSQMDLAEIQYQNAVTALQGLVDAHQVISPIDGIVTKKMVNDGDTVSAGQLLAVVSTPDRIKVSFFVDEESMKLLTAGTIIQVRLNDGTTATSTIMSITPSADPVTKRYLIDARPNETLLLQQISIGSLATVVVPFTQPAKGDAFFIPLSAIDVAQNENSIYIADTTSTVKKISVHINSVDGESAQVTADIPNDALVVVDGSKLLKDGARIEMQEEEKLTHQAPAQQEGAKMQTPAF